jgi:hypothetical protein
MGCLKGEGTCAIWSLCGTVARAGAAYRIEIMAFYFLRVFSAFRFLITDLIFLNAKAQGTHSPAQQLRLHLNEFGYCCTITTQPYRDTAFYAFITDNSQASGFYCPKRYRMDWSCTSLQKITN